MDCPVIIDKDVCVQTKISVSGNACAGKARVCCVEEPEFEKCPGDDCTYIVSQKLCIKFPLKISAEAKARPAGIVCDGQKPYRPMHRCRRRCANPFAFLLFLLLYF